MISGRNSMTKKKKPKPSAKSKQLSCQEHHQQISQQKSRKSLTIFQKMCRLFFSLIAIVGFLFLVYPRLSVSPGESLDPYEPFSTPFIIKNDGHLPLFNVNYSITLNNMEDINHSHYIIGKIPGISKNIPKLSPNKSTTIFINKMIDAPPNFIKYAEIYVNVTYKLYNIIPYTFTENIRFKTEKKANNEYLWLQYYSGQ